MLFNYSTCGLVLVRWMGGLEGIRDDICLEILLPKEQYVNEDFNLTAHLKQEILTELQAIRTEQGLTGTRTRTRSCEAFGHSRINGLAIECEIPKPREFDLRLGELPPVGSEIAPVEPDATICARGGVPYDLAPSVLVEWRGQIDGLPGTQCFHLILPKANYEDASFPLDQWLGEQFTEMIAGHLERCGLSGGRVRTSSVEAFAYEKRNLLHCESPIPGGAVRPLNVRLGGI